MDQFPPAQSSEEGFVACPHCHYRWVYAAGLIDPGDLLHCTVCGHGPFPLVPLRLRTVTEDECEQLLLDWKEETDNSSCVYTVVGQEDRPLEHRQIRMDGAFLLSDLRLLLYRFDELAEVDA